MKPKRFIVLLPSVPAERPAASATTPAGQALPAAAAPAHTYTVRPQRRDDTQEGTQRAY